MGKSITRLNKQTFVLNNTQKPKHMQDANKHKIETIQ